MHTGNSILSVHLLNSRRNTWTKVVVTIPGDTAGTWVLSGNGAGVVVYFDLGSGSTYRAAANAWAAGDYGA